jgi:hypothetical protein
MIAIHTKFIPASATKGARIKAYTSTKWQATVPYPYDKSYELAHFEAVKALIEKNNLEWDLTNMRHGDSADGKGYVFCFANSVVGA